MKQRDLNQNNAENNKEEIEHKKYWIWFSIINISVKKKHMLLNKYAIEEIYNLEASSLEKNKRLTKREIEEIENEKHKEDLDKHISYLENNNIDIIEIDSKRYPLKLKQIADPPIVIYVRGDIEILNSKSVGIIGSRVASGYGIEVATKFGYEIAKNKINIVSGLAKGIDSYSHIGNIKALKENIEYGKCIAVLGNGLDQIYPKENINLAKEILNTGGIIISEYPLGTKPLKMNFPARNRIISALSDKIIVVEAVEKSGTLITVDFALEQGKEVFVVPGNILNKNSKGTNSLIKQGALVITEYTDIL